MLMYVNVYMDTCCSVCLSVRVDVCLRRSKNFHHYLQTRKAHNFNGDALTF